MLIYPRATGLKARLFKMPMLFLLASRVETDCYHCNEVDSWFVGILLGLLRRKKVVFDVHEHYPSTFVEKRFPKKLAPFGMACLRLLMNVFAAFTDRLVFAKRSVAKDFKRADGRGVLVRNFPVLSYAKNGVGAPRTDSLSLPPTRETIVQAIHLGLMSRPRGWPQLLDAMSRMETVNFTVQFVGIFNDGSEEDFWERVRELGLGDRVVVENWLPFGEAFERVLSSQIGLVLFQPGFLNHVYAFPHKMFDYMMGGLPVVVPEFAVEIAPIVVQRECGLLVDTSDPESIAEALDRLAKDAMVRGRLGENGRKAVVDELNWESEFEKLKSMYEGLMER
jgi:glycosyltransferase involved in cell wall biosynthesis